MKILKKAVALLIIGVVGFFIGWQIGSWVNPEVNISIVEDSIKAETDTISKLDSIIVVKTDSIIINN